jgi:hypothetical protein
MPVGKRFVRSFLGSHRCDFFCHAPMLGLPNYNQRREAMLNRRMLFKCIAAVGLSSIFSARVSRAAQQLSSGCRANRLSDPFRSKDLIFKETPKPDRNFSAIEQWRDILDDLDGAELVRRYTSLDEVTERMVQPERLRGRCPFCYAQFDSLLVYNDENLYYCENCGAEGTVLEFYARTECISHGEAVSHLRQLLDSKELSGRCHRQLAFEESGDGRIF